MLNVNVEITKPRNPSGVALAYLVTCSVACGTFGARYNYSSCLSNVLPKLHEILPKEAYLLEKLRGQSDISRRMC